MLSKIYLHNFGNLMHGLNMPEEAIKILAAKFKMLN